MASTDAKAGREGKAKATALAAALGIARRLADRQDPAAALSALSKIVVGSVEAGTAPGPNDSILTVCLLKCDCRSVVFLSLSHSCFLLGSVCSPFKLSGVYVPALN